MRTLLVLLALAAVPISAQEELVETIEVRVVNVDVVVTDRDGKPVTGLTKNDFEILEDRRPQTITNFYELRGGVPATSGGEAPVTVPPRNFILFIENQKMHPILRKDVVAQLKKFVDTQLRGDDQASVVSWSRTLSIDAPLTSDKAKLHAALDKVANTGSPNAVKSDFQALQQQCTSLLNFALSGRMPVRVAYEECISDARMEAQRITLSSRAVLNALEVAMATVAGVEGKKIVVVAGTELPVRPGLDMFLWANATFGRFMTGFDAAIARPQEEERAQGELLEQLGRSANAHGATLYLLSVLMPTDNYTATEAYGIGDAGGDFLRSGNTEEAHEKLAKLTGGAAGSMARVNNLLDTIGSDLSSYYSLGYRPTTDLRGNRPIAVRAKNRNYTVRARQSYAPKTLSDQMNDRVIANIFTPARENQWNVELRTSAPQLVEKGKYTVDVEIVAPPTVTLIPQGDELAGGFTVFVAVGSPQGALSTTFRQPNGIRIKASDEKSFRAEPIVFTSTLTVREGENLLSVGLVDQVSNEAGFARATVKAASK